MDLTQIKYILVAIASAFSIAYTLPTSLQKNVLSETIDVSQSPTVTPVQQPVNSNNTAPKQLGLFEEVNKARNLNHLASLELRDDLCLIANHRLNEQIVNGKLDGHAGFRSIKANYPNFAAIFDKYTLVAEFLAYGGKSPQDTVLLWNNSTNHKKLLDDGTFRYGCIVSKSLFAVAIASY